MTREKWTEYRFEDGTAVTVRKLSAQELAVEKRKHGKLISKKEVRG